jgi:hypothetical protein
VNASRVLSGQIATRRQEMALVKKPPETIERQIRLEEPVSRLLDEYSKFVECTPDHVTNFALRRMLARDREYKKWKASQEPPSTGQGSTAPSARTT